MSVWGIIRNLRFREISALSKIFLKNPRYFIPTLKATAETINCCDIRFGDEHHLNNRTNAFRHAYWNYLICVKCFNVYGTAGEVAAWAKKITDLHEDLSPNKELAREMDLHNNLIGRKVFLQHPEGISNHFNFFKDLMVQAKRVKSVEEFKNSVNHLVFIEN